MTFKEKRRKELMMGIASGLIGSALGILIFNLIA